MLYYMVCVRVYTSNQAVFLFLYVVPYPIRNEVEMFVAQQHNIVK